MNFSVILRNRNEERYIGYCIQSLVDFLGDGVEIVLVDNESTDDSIRIVNTFDYLNIKKVDISKNNYTPGRALNLGVENCTNDYIFVISAHCEIVKLNPNEVIEELSLTDVVAIWGKQVPLWNGKRITPRYIWSNFTDKSTVNYFCENEDRYFLHNGCAFYNKHDLIDYPFGEHHSGKEDRFWVNDMIGRDNKVVYNPDIVVNHHYTSDGATWLGVG
jgi:glycosyltransferase involved in cell wall biosynthesis